MGDLDEGLEVEWQVGPSTLSGWGQRQFIRRGGIGIRELGDDKFTEEGEQRPYSWTKSKALQHREHPIHKMYKMMENILQNKY